jgi:hypothetical protein
MTAEDEARFARGNAKGQLLEHGVVHRLTPVFDVRPLVTPSGPCFEASAHVVLADGREVWSALRRGSKEKLVEHAVATSLLEELAAERDTEGDDVPDVGDDPRTVLNELRQKGQVRDYGFTLVRTEGPPHAPVFHVAGYVERNAGVRIEAAPDGAPSKKIGERLVALRLVRMLMARP